MPQGFNRVFQGMRWQYCLTVSNRQHMVAPLKGALERGRCASLKPWEPLQVVIRGKVCRVVGHGGMNMHMIDITDVPDAKVGLRAWPIALSAAPTAQRPQIAEDRFFLLRITHVRRLSHACQCLCLL